MNKLTADMPSMIIKLAFFSTVAMMSTLIEFLLQINR